MDMNFVDSNGKQYTMPAQALHANAVHNEITKNDYPHPTITMGIVVITIVIIYLIYILVIKPNFSGIWYNNGGIRVQHNAFTDTITINNSLHGHATGNALYIKTSTGTKYGIVNGKKIYWINSDETWSLPTRAL